MSGRLAIGPELRRGAAHIKIMASGGVASPTDPLDRCQYSDDEIRAAVEEADRAGSYVAAHCHPKEAVRRAAALGVRSIEHATLIDQPTADYVAEKGVFTVPTMAIMVGLLEEGEKLGLPAASHVWLNFGGAVITPALVTAAPNDATLALVQFVVPAALPSTSPVSVMIGTGTRLSAAYSLDIQPPPPPATGGSSTGSSPAH